MGVELFFYILPEDYGWRPSGQALARLAQAWVGAGYVPVPPGYVPPDGKAVPPPVLAAGGWTRRDSQARATGALVQVNRQPAQPLPFDGLARRFETLLQSPEFEVAWPIEYSTAALSRYPFEGQDRAAQRDFAAMLEGGTAYLSIRLQVADDYLERMSELIDPLPETRCAKCSSDQRYDLPYTFGDNELFYNGRLRRVCNVCGTRFSPQAYPVRVRDPWVGDEHIVMGGAASRFAIMLDCHKCWMMAMQPQRAFLALSEAALGIKLRVVADASP